MASTPNQLEIEFAEAADNWNLEKLYIDLSSAKGKSLTPVEKKFLRGLLCGYSPAEIADKVYQSRNSNAVRVYLSNGLYKYIEELLIRKTGNLTKVRTWSRVIHLLEEAGYKTASFELAQAGKVTSEQEQTKTNSVTRKDQHQDWGEAVDVSFFYGRNEALSQLEHWIVKDSCRLVAILGMGGIGKTALSIRCAQQLQDKFNFLIWRSLSHAPPVQELLKDLIQSLSNKRNNLPDTVTGRISLLIEYLRASRCLLVLDNVEALVSSSDSYSSNSHDGFYRAGYEDYGQLFRRIAETSHKSCLVLTSREQSRELVSLTGDRLPVRTLKLCGLKPVEAQRILQTKGDFSGSEEDWKALTEYYAGNPQILKIVATTIQSLCQGDIAQFLAQGPVIIGDIRELLDQQFNRLSDLEKKLMYWLAIKQGSVVLPEWRGKVAPPVSQSELLEALESLGRRSLIDKSSTGFIQTPIVMEYVTKLLIDKIFQ
ncbi:MAG: hypothetical protein JOZ78_03480 [Chroococcidiopsidaceae cyanobacterium CP_BM_ER_R8_30]|nr:hypothetical protein [Chroococcidiopsidaceae cyanobacterium CP_BM_ER_R8_30]